MADAKYGEFNDKRGDHQTRGGDGAAGFVEQGEKHRTIRTIIFAKAPQPGKVKTRLIPALGAKGAASLAGKLLLNMAQQAVEAEIGPVEVSASPEPTSMEWQAMRSHTQMPSRLDWSVQGEGDLGERLNRAVERVIDAGEHVFLIGADCPGLTPSVLREAARCLRAHDAVMIPATDGGYVLLGLRGAAPTVFRDMPWSTETVAEQTHLRLAALGLTCHTLPALHDIDEPEDLEHLPDRLCGAICA